jgi:hypothetical protein
MSRYCVSQGSAEWGDRTWYNVIDQRDPLFHRIIASCETQADACNVCTAMNAYHNWVMEAQG